MKKLLQYVMLVLGVVLLVGCSDSGGTTTAGETSDKVIGYAINNLNDTFQTYILNEAEAKATELGYKVEVSNAEEDLIKQQDQVNTMIANGVDGIIVVPVDTSAMDPITNAAIDAGITLVYVNRNPFTDLDEIPEGVYYVGVNEYQGGQTQAEYGAELLGDKGGGVAILMGILGQEAQVLRTGGARDTFEESYPNIEVLAEETALWQRDQAVTLTENWISAYGDDLKLILANNDEMALGALQAIEANNLADIHVIGTDLIPDAVQAIKEGKLSASVFQDPVFQGQKAVEILDALAKGETWNETFQLADFVLVNEDNVSEYE